MEVVCGTGPGPVSVNPSGCGPPHPAGIGGMFVHPSQPSAEMVKVRLGPVSEIRAPIRFGAGRVDEPILKRQAVGGIEVLDGTPMQWRS